MKPTTIATTRHDLEKFVRLAAPGAICLYHVGELALDRETNANLGNMILDTLAYAAAGYDNEGKVYLVQRRLEENKYQYFAIRGTDAGSAMALAA